MTPDSLNPNKSARLAATRRGARRLTLALTCIALPFYLSACNDKSTGSKRADDKAAHTARYHPDIPPSRMSSSRPDTNTTASEAQPSLTWTPGPAGSPVMFVNDDTITIQDIMEPIINELTRQSKIQDEATYRDTVMRLVRNQVDHYISVLAVYQQAKNTFSEKKAQEAFEKRADDLIKERITRDFGGVRARYEEHLQSFDFKPADMKERIKREAMVLEFLKQRFKPMLKEPPRRELKKYYDDHIKDYTTPAKVELFLIELPTADMLGKPVEQATPQEIAAARQKARSRLIRAREELDSGVEFAAVAKAYSKGPVARQGGAWGEISPGGLTKRWAKPAEVLFTLQSGQISDVIETPEAFFIVKCGKHTPAEQVTFEKAQEKIIDQLINDQFNRLHDNYIRELITTATIRKRAEFFDAIFAAVPRPARLRTGQEAKTPAGG